VETCLITLIEVDRVWFKSKCGMEGTEGDRNSSFCTFACLPQTPDILVVLDAPFHHRFKNYPAVTGPPFLRFYAGARLLVAGVVLGTLCIFDSKPRTEFSLQDQMLLLSFGAMVSNAIVMRRSQEYRLQEKMSRPYQMKCYASMNLLSLKHNLRTPLSTLSMQIQEMTHENSNQLSQSLQMQSRLVGKMVEICLHAIAALVSKDIFSSSPHLQLWRKNSNHPSGDLFNLSSLHQIIEDIVKFVIQFHSPVKLSNGERLMTMLTTSLSLNNPEEDLMSERSFSQLFLIAMVINLCHAMRLTNEIPNSEMEVILDLEEDEDREIGNGNESASMNLKKTRWTGNIGCRITIIFPPTPSAPTSASASASACRSTPLGRVGGVDPKTLNRLKKTQYRSELNQMIYLVGGGVSIRDVSGSLELGCWVPYSRETVHVGDHERGNVPCSCFASQSEVRCEGPQKESKKLLRVLLVDDSELVHEQFRDIFRDQNCELVSVCNGALGLAELQKSTSVGRSFGSVVASARLPSTDAKNPHTTSSNFTNLISDRNRLNEVSCSYDLVFVDLLMPTKSGVDMMRDFLDWIQSQLRIGLSSQPLSSFSSASSAPASVTARASASTTAPRVKKFLGDGFTGGTRFVALLPLGCSFDEMAMVGDDADDSDEDGDQEDKSLSPEAFGFDFVLDKPLERSLVMEILLKHRESMTMTPPQIVPQNPTTKAMDPKTNPVHCQSSVDPSPSSSVSLLQFFRQLFSVKARKVYPS
jgi:CheY-like chemotaxis protein